MHINPRYETTKLLLEQENQYQDALEKAEDLKDVRDELLTKYNALPKENIAKLERLIPDKLNTVKLIADIDSISGKYGIPVRAVKVSEEMADNAQQIQTEFTPKPYKTTTISFKAAATYENLVPFLQDLEKSLQLIDVKGITFNADDGINNGINDYDITILTYSLK